MSSTYSNTSSNIYQSLTLIPQNMEQMKQAINRLKAGASYFGCGGYLCSLDRLHQLDIFTKLGFERLERKHRVIACYTALRFSDINRLNEATISDLVITLYQTKTKEEVQIPILKEISPLITRYQQTSFPKLNISRTNNIIRELARRCGINDTISYKEQRGGVVTIKQQPKWTKISFHTARRSCITNLYRRGYPINYIMTLSGHHSVQAFQRYVRASTQEIVTNFVDLLKKENAM